MTLAILLFALIVATCFIAYFADNLGKHLGKKRVSLKVGRFNLRPRQTATLISMASSVAIMLLTLGFLMLASKSIRNSLLRYDAEKKDANLLRKKNETLVRDLSTQRNRLEKQAGDLNSQIAANRKLAGAVVSQRRQAESQLKKANENLGSVRVLLASAQRARGAASRGVAAAKAGESAAIARGRAAQTRFASAQLRFQTVQSQLGSAQRQFKNAQQRLSQESRRVAEANRRLQKVNQSLGATQSQLQQARENLQQAQERQRDASNQLQTATAQLKETERNFESVKSQVAATQAQYDSAAEDIEELKVLRTRLEQELEQKTQELKDYTKVALQIATGDVGIKLGDVFAEKTFRPGMSSRQAREALGELMKTGRDALQAPNQNLTLVWPSSMTSGEENSSLTEEEFLRGFAADLSTLGASASVRLVAARDHARQEADVFARLTLIVVRVIFPQGDVLASADIDASGSDGQIFNQLLALLNETEKRARDRRVAPLITPDNQYFYAAGTNERIFEALRKIQAEGGIVKVKLLAAEDITTVESMRVRFEITKE